jgi:transposase-like protein
MEMLSTGDQATKSKKKDSWTNEDKVELIKLRLQGLTFEQIGNQLGRTKHSARSEYGRIRRGETDVTLSLKELPELRKFLPVKKTDSI